MLLSPFCQLFISCPPLLVCPTVRRATGYSTSSQSPVKSPGKQILSTWCIKWAGVVPMCTTIWPHNITSVKLCSRTEHRTHLTNSIQKHAIKKETRSWLSLSTEVAGLCPTLMPYSPWSLTTAALHCLTSWASVLPIRPLYLKPALWPASSLQSYIASNLGSDSTRHLQFKLCLSVRQAISLLVALI